LAGLAAASAALWVRGAFAAEPLVLVVGTHSPVTNLDSNELRRIFLEKPTVGPGGVSYVALNHPKSSPYRARFDQAVLRMDPDEVQRYWVDQKIRGMKSPRVVDPGAIPLLLEKVPGAVAYLPLSAAKGVKAVSIDGKAPTASGYLLR